MDRLLFYRIPDTEDFREYVYPERWDDFVSKFRIDDPKENVDVLKIIEAVSEETAEAFGVSKASVFGNYTTNKTGRINAVERNLQDARIFATFVLSKIGLPSWMISEKIGLCVHTIKYRSSNFMSFYENDPFFNRRVQYAFSRLYDRGYMIIKVSK